MLINSNYSIKSLGFLSKTNGLIFLAMKLYYLIIIMRLPDLISTLYQKLYSTNFRHVILQYIVYGYEKLNISALE